MSENNYRRLKIIFCVAFFILSGALIVDLIVLSKAKGNYQTIENITKVVGDIVYYDEVLTMSARMAAYSGDVSWEARYLKNADALDRAIARAYDIAPEEEYTESTKQTDIANQKLINMETQAFDLVEAGDREGAVALLFSNEYFREKKAYTHGMETLRSVLVLKKQALEFQHSQTIVFSFILSGILFTIIFVFLYSNVQKARKQAEIEIKRQELDKMAHLGHMAGGLAHEINNALVPILGLGSLIHTRMKAEGSQYAEHMGTLHQSAMHAREIVSNVLLFVRGETSEKSVVKGNVFAMHAISFAKNILSPNVLVKIVYGPDFQVRSDFYVKVNKSEFMQVITNMFANAEHAMGGAGQLKIKGEITTLKKTVAN